MAFSIECNCVVQSMHVLCRGWKLWWGLVLVKGENALIHIDILKRILCTWYQYYYSIVSMSLVDTISASSKNIGAIYYHLRGTAIVLVPSSNN